MRDFTRTQTAFNRFNQITHRTNSNFFFCCSDANDHVNRFNNVVTCSPQSHTDTIETASRESIARQITHSLQSKYIQLLRQLCGKNYDQKLCSDKKIKKIARNEELIVFFCFDHVDITQRIIAKKNIKIDDEMVLTKFPFRLCLEKCRRANDCDQRRHIVIIQMTVVLVLISTPMDQHTRTSGSCKHQGKCLLRSMQFRRKISHISHILTHTLNQLTNSQSHSFLYRIF